MNLVYIFVKDLMLKSEWNPFRLPMSINIEAGSPLNQPLLIITGDMGVRAGYVGLFLGDESEGRTRHG